MQNTALFDVSSKWRIRHQDVKVKPFVLRGFGSQSLRNGQNLIAISLHPFLSRSVSVQSLQRSKSNVFKCKTFVSPSPAIRFNVLATLTVFSSKSIPNTLQYVLFICFGEIPSWVKSCPGEFENRMHWKTTTAGSSINHVFARLGIQHLAHTYQLHIGV